MSEAPEEHEVEHTEASASRLIKVVNQKEENREELGEEEERREVRRGGRSLDAREEESRAMGKLRRKLEQEDVITNEELMDMIAWKHNVFP